MKKTLFSTLTALALFTASSLHADEIKEQLNEATKLYEEKDYKGAMDELKFITAQLQKLDAEENQKLLPQALEGWKKQENKNSSQSGMAMLGGGGTTMEATYTKESERIEIQMMANSPMISMLSMAISNPALMAASADTKPFRYKKNKGMKKSNGKNTEITLLIAGQILLTLKGSNLKDASILDQYLDTIDIKKLKSELL